MATVGRYSFPDERRWDGQFAAWLEGGDQREDGAFVDAPDGSAQWYFLDSDEAETDPIGVLLISRSITAEGPVDRDVMLPDGSRARLRDNRALAAARSAA